MFYTDISFWTHLEVLYIATEKVCVCVCINFLLFFFLWNKFVYFLMLDWISDWIII